MHLSHSTCRGQGSGSFIPLSEASESAQLPRRLSDVAGVTRFEAVTLKVCLPTRSVGLAFT